jgi:hypothetical protein
MQNYSTQDGYYINDFHRLNSMAAQREAYYMSLQPYSRAQKLNQIQSLRQSSIPLGRRPYVSINPAVAAKL